MNFAYVDRWNLGLINCEFCLSLTFAIMFSYIRVIESLVDPGVYTRGIKYYLEGRVVSKKDLTLDYWRLYEVVGNQSYFVKIPLLHLALSRDKFDHAEIALMETVSCDCPYFLEHGVCKHIVAVCASLEEEFFQPSHHKNIKKNKTEDEILDNIFRVEEGRKQQSFIQNLEYCLEKDCSNEMITMRLSDFLEYFDRKRLSVEGWLEVADSVIKDNLKQYEAEKRVVRIITNYYLFSIGGLPWWCFWKEYLSYLSLKSQENLWLKLWKLLDLGLNSEIGEELRKEIKKLDTSNKRNILEELQIELPENKETWVEFCFQAEYPDWIAENLDELDPFYLLQAATLLPEKSEVIEIRLRNQVKIGIDFLRTGDYKELLDILKTWKENLGRSSYFEEVIQYIKTSHPKKKKLLKEIEKL